MIKIKSEHIIVHSLNQNDFTKYIELSTNIGNIQDNYVNECKFKNQILYMLLNQSNELLSYIIIQNNNGYLWLMEIVTIEKGRSHEQQTAVVFT